MNQTFDISFFLQKMERYCAFQERCSLDISQKMRALGVPESLKLPLINQLMEQGFYNDIRFAELFVRSKLNQGWGRAKITNALIQKNIGKEIIAQYLKELDDDLYREKLMQIIQRKIAEFKKPLAFKDKQKILQYAMRKGYESQLVIKILNDNKINIDD